MPHLDEGRLTAWVDGALAPGGPEAREVERHLAACEDCRHRLEEARALRERASAIFARADLPVVPGPGLEALAERAAEVERQGGRPTGKSTGLGPRATTTRGLAWAASLALAVGAGWIARDLALRRGEPLPPSGVAPATVDVRDGTDRVSAPPPVAAAEQEAMEESPASERDRVKAERSVRTDDLAETPVARAPRSDGAAVAGPPEAAASPSFHAPPPRERVDAATGAGAAAAGCWSRIPDPAAPDVPQRIRLSSDPDVVPGGATGGRVLSGPGDDAWATWVPFGPDSVWVGGEGLMTMRLRVSGDRLEGRAVPREAAGEAGVAGSRTAGKEPAGVAWRRVSCEP